MPRVIPPFPEGFKAKSRRSDQVSLECTVRLVTPMFGGGVKPGNPDGLTPIRGTTIRGHLRFWWRATRGAAFTSVGDLKKREDEIWGSTENPSPVSVSVEVPEDAKLAFRSYDRDEPFQFHKLSPELYALFAAVENKVGRLVHEGLEFKVGILWPNAHRIQQLRDAENQRRRRQSEPLLDPRIADITPDVEAAIAAWLAFGGLGSHTRRGCGSIGIAEVKGSPLINRKLPEVKVGTAGFPVGSRLFVGNGRFREAMAAWRAAVEVYRNFRQGFADASGQFHFRGRRHGKTFPGGGRGTVPGRSHWPEPESLHYLTGCALRLKGAAPGGPPVPPDEDTHDHSRAMPQVPRNLLPAFPRAVLGLPIVFHFSDGPGKDHRGESRPAEVDKDPAATELRPLLGRNEDGAPVGSRMASPVITKAVQIGNEWVPAVLLLPHQHALAVQCVLVGRAIPGTWGGQQFDPTGLPLDRDIPNSEIINAAFGTFEPMQGQTSAIDALVAFITDPSRGFQEART